MLAKAASAPPQDQTPPPTPAGQSVTCGLGHFDAADEPGACWRPYSNSSPFNIPLPASPPIAPDSAAIVTRLLGFGPIQKFAAGTADSPDDWGHPIYFSQPSDPRYTINCTTDWGQCSTLDGTELHIPAAALAAGGGDAHMAVIDQSSGWEYDFWQVQSKPPGVGTLTVSSAGRTVITGDGLDSGATASYFGLAAGSIRGEEIQAGEIDHALALTVYCVNGTVWPAVGSARTCSSMGLSSDDAPALGEHFYLDMTDAQIYALPDPAWQKTILRAMADYGMFVADTGTSSWGIQIESGSSYTSFGRADPWVTFAQQAGVPSYPAANGTRYVFDLSQAVDWASRLRVAQG